MAEGGMLEVAMTEIVTKLLIKEAAPEATKKGFCGTVIGRAEDDRDLRWPDVKTLDSEFADLEVKLEELPTTIGLSANAMTVIVMAEQFVATWKCQLEKATTYEESNAGTMRRSGGDGVIGVLGHLDDFLVSTAFEACPCALQLVALVTTVLCRC